MTDASVSPPTAIRDYWLRPVLASFLDEDTIASLEREANGSLWEVSTTRGAAEERDLVARTARYFHLPVADLGRVSSQALELVPERWARRFGVLPLSIDDDALVVATSNPCDVHCERAIAFAAGRRVRFAMASPAGISARIDAAYRGEDDEGEALHRAEESKSRVDV